MASHLKSKSGNITELPCQTCDADNPVWWVDDDIWNRIMGTADNPRGEGIIVCPSCFSRRILEQLGAARQLANLVCCLNGSRSHPTVVELAQKIAPEDEDVKLAALSYSATDPHRPPDPQVENV